MLHHVEGKPGLHVTVILKRGVQRKLIETIIAFVGVLIEALMVIGLFGYSLEHSISGALMANVVDYSYYTTGINARAFLYQVSAMSANLSGIIKTAALGYGLAYFGFDAKAITDRAIMGIRLITAFVPTFFLVIGIIAYILFPITEQKLQEAKDAFEAKQAAKAE